jgi:hypothetical protein
MRRGRAAALIAAAALVAGTALVVAPSASAATCPTVSPAGEVSPAAAPGVDWSGCDLAGADLTGANLQDADLSGADLTGADLTSANLLRADLTGATTTGVVWTGSMCPDAEGAQFHNHGSCVEPLDTAAPTGSLDALPRYSLSRRIPLSWSIGDGEGLGIAQNDLQLTFAPAFEAYPVSPWLVAAYAVRGSSRTYVAFTGQRYCFRLAFSDYASLTGTTAPRCTELPMDDRDLFTEGRWRRTNEARWLAASVSSTTSRGAALYVGLPGPITRGGVVATICPTCGAVDYYAGGRKIGRISLAGPYVAKKILLLPRFAATKAHVRVVVVSSGKPVRIDGVIASRY